jgi:hypothetical protein
MAGKTPGRPTRPRAPAGPLAMNQESPGWRLVLQTVTGDARRLRFRRCGVMRKPVSSAQERIADGGNLFRIWAV